MKTLFFFSFLCAFNHSIITTPIEYNGMIELYIRPERKSLEKKFQELAQYKTDDSMPPVSYNNNNLPHKGQGLDLFDRPSNFLNQQKEELANDILQKSISGVPGCICFYKGYAEISGPDGYLSFPRLETKPEVTIIICKMINPVILHGQNPSYFVTAGSSKWYNYSTISENNSLQLTWKLKEISPPADHKIPNNAIIIFANPNSISFDKTELTFPFSQNIILPELFYQSKRPIHVYSLEILDILRFYKELGFNIKQASVEKSIHLAKKINNTTMVTPNTLL